MQAPATDALDPAAIAASFEAVRPLTIGLEEEAFLLDRDSLQLVPRAQELLARAPSDARLKAELPAAQIEIVTPPSPTAADAVALLADGRAALSVLLRGRDPADDRGRSPVRAGRG